MKHDLRLFDRAPDRAGWYLRAQAERRRAARTAALISGAGATAAAILTGLAMHYGSAGAAVLLGTVCALLAVVAATANSEA